MPLILLKIILWFALWVTAPAPQTLMPGLSPFTAGCSLTSHPASKLGAVWLLSAETPVGSSWASLRSFCCHSLMSHPVSGILLPALLWVGQLCHLCPSESVLALTKRAGPLWSCYCLEILPLTLEQLSFASKQVPAWHCQPQTEFNPSSGNELCHSWDRKPKLDFATSLFCSFWKKVRETQMPKLGKADLGMTDLLDNLILASDPGWDFDHSQGVNMSRMFRPACPSVYVEICGKELRISPQKHELGAGPSIQFWWGSTSTLVSGDWRCLGKQSLFLFTMSKQGVQNYNLKF